MFTNGWLTCLVFALVIAACAPPEGAKPTTTTVEEKVSTTSTSTTTASTSTTSTTSTSITTTPQAYRESWTQALVDAANADDFGQLDSHAFVSVERRDLFQAFVEFGMPQLETAGPCWLDERGAGCPFSFDGTQTFSVSFDPDGEEMFTDLSVQPEILEAIAPDGAHGSGCSPGPGPLPDGEWLGFISERRSDEFEFDLICLIPNDWVDWAPVNESTASRTISVDPDVLVANVTPANSTYATWEGEWCDIGGPCPVWISIRD